MEQNKINWGDSCILISRVSTDQQVFLETSPQIADLKDYAEKRGYRHFKVINTVESGFLQKDDKVGWNIVTEFIEANPQYRTIFITEMSRLSRIREILFYIQSYLQRNKIQLIIKDLGGFSLFNEEGEIDLGHDIVFSLYASLAAAEMKQKRERFLRASREYKKQGMSIGGKRLFGYDREPHPKNKAKNTYVKNNLEAEEIRQVFVWYAYGINNDLTRTSLSTIVLECKALGFSKYLHSKRNVTKLLKEEAYTGYKITHNKRINAANVNYHIAGEPKYVYANEFECTYPQLIERSLFDLVQDRLEENCTHVDKASRTDKSSKHITILSKLIICRFCGQCFVGDYRYSKGYIKFSYRCGGAKGMKELRKCNETQFISMRMLDSAIWTFIKEKVKDILAMQDNSRSESKRNELVSRITNLDESYKALDKEYDDAEMIFSRNKRRNYEAAKEKYFRRCDDLDNERERIEKKIAEYKHTLELFDTTLSNDIQEQLANNIESVEKNKQVLYNFVHLLIKEIKPLQNDNKQLILRVTALNNIQDVLNFSEDNTDGLPTIVGEKNDGTFFILIRKTTRPQFTMRVIDDCLIKWDDSINQFRDGEECYTFDNLFNLNLEGHETTPLALGMTEHIVKYLDCYSEDIPK